MGFQTFEACTHNAQYLALQLCIGRPNPGDLGLGFRVMVVLSAHSSHKMYYNVSLMPPPTRGRVVQNENQSLSTSTAGSPGPISLSQTPERFTNYTIYLILW